MGYNAIKATAMASWPMQDNAASTVVEDVVGALDGTLVGAVSTSANSVAGPTTYLPLALNFDGLDDCINWPSYETLVPGAGSPRSYEMWIKARTGDWYNNFISLNNSSVNPYVLLELINRPIIYLSGSNYQYFTDIGAGVVKDYGWHHIVVVVAGTGTNDIDNCQLYIDGVAMTKSGAPTKAGGPLAFTALRTSGIGAALTEVQSRAGFAVYNGILTSADAAELAAGPEPVNVTAPVLNTSGAVTSGTWDLQNNGPLVKRTTTLKLTSDNSTVMELTGDNPNFFPFITNGVSYYVVERAENDGGFESLEDTSSGNVVMSITPREVWAVAAGSVDTPGTWNINDVPGPNDDVYLNSYAITCGAGADLTFRSLQNTTSVLTGTVVAGGTFTISAARTLTIGAIRIRTDAATINGLVQVTATTGLVQITGSYYQNGASGTSSYCIHKLGGCDLNVFGTFQTSATSASTTIHISAAGTVNIGSLTNPANCPTMLGGASYVSVSHASCVFSMWATQFAAGNNANCLTLTLAATAYTKGPAIGGVASSRSGIFSNIAGSHTHNGSVTGGVTATAAGITKTGAGNLIINGDVVGTSGYGFYVTSTSGLTTINGNCIAGSTVAVNHSGGSSITINGNLKRRTHNNIAGMAFGPGTIVINNPSEILPGYGGSSAHGITLAGSTCTINGDIRGGYASASVYGVSVSGAGTLTVNGVAYAGTKTTAIGVSASSTAVVTVNKAVGNEYGYQVSTNSAAIVSSVGVANLGNTATVRVKELEDGPRGNQPTSGPVLILEDSVNKILMRYSAAGPIATLLPDTGDAEEMLIQSAGYVGDFKKSKIVRFTFGTTHQRVQTTLAGGPTLAIYKNGGATELTNSITLTVDFDARTGRHLVAVDTSHADYADSGDYHVILTAGTVGAVSVVGMEVGSFSLENRTGDAARVAAEVAASASQY